MKIAWRALSTLLVAALMLSPALAGDLSCIGVQGMAAQMRVNALSPDQQAQFAPAVSALKTYAAQAETEMKQAEKATTADWATVKNANPNATQEQLGQLYQEYIRQSADADNHYAEMLQAQFQVHIGEGQMIAAGSQIPSPGDSGKLQRLADAYISSQRDAAAYGRMRSSATLDHLIGVVAASKAAAENGAGIPTTAVARIGFDVPGPAIHGLASATAALSGDAVAAEALRTVGTLQVDHVLIEDVGDTAFRSALRQKAESPTWQTVSAELGGGLQNIAIADNAQKTVAGALPKDSPPVDANQRTAWTNRVAQTAQQAATQAGVMIQYAQPKIIDALPSSLAPLSPPPKP